MDWYMEELKPVSPTGQYFNSSVMSTWILAVLEFDIPINDAKAIPLLRDVFLPINSRFSSIMIEDMKGEKRWKKVEVRLEDHIKVPIFPSGLSIESYDNYFDEYLSEVAMQNFPQSRPLWEIHIVKYQTSNAAGNIIFKLHHALGDGYSLMGALLSCLQRADDPSLPLTFPSRKRSQVLFTNETNSTTSSVLKYLPKIFFYLFNTVTDFSWSMLKSTILEDDRTPIRTGTDLIGFEVDTITTISFSLDQIKFIKSKLGVTINDVTAGIIFLGSRMYMQEIVKESRKSSCTALVLLNTRMFGGDYKSVEEMIKPDSKMPWGNQFAFLHVQVPKLSKSSNPLDFVWHARKTILKKRKSMAVYLNSWILDTLRKLRGREAAARLLRKTTINASMVMSNMIGPIEQLSLDNHPIRGLYFTVIDSTKCLGISIVSYMGKLRVAFKMEKGVIDPRKLKLCMENAFETIFRATLNTPTTN